MRISGGTAKGRKVGNRKAFVAKGDSDELRPTAAKVRQAIFNIVAGMTDGCRFLDLYAGTGAVGIEALSRGAQQAVFVENSAQRCSFIRDIADKFGLAVRASVVKAEAGEFLKKNSMPFDIIFIDPPYASDELLSALRLIDTLLPVSENGVVIAEHSSKRALSLFMINLQPRKSYKYGDTALTVYERKPRQADEMVSEAPIKV